MRSFSVPPLAGCVVCLLFAGTSTLHAGLIPNSDFESDDGEASPSPVRWFSGGDVSYELADDSDGAGERSVQINANSADWRSSAVFVTPGELLDWTLDYKWLDGAAGEFSADIRFFASLDPIGGGTAGAFKGEQRINIASSNHGQWQSLGLNSIEVPEGALTADVRISSGFFDAGMSGAGFRIDNVVVGVPEPACGLLAVVALTLVGAGRRRR